MEVAECKGKDRGLHRVVFTLPKVDDARLILAKRDKLKQKQLGGQAEKKVSVWVDLTEQERANKKLIESNKAFQDAKKRISDVREAQRAADARPNGTQGLFSMGWDLDRAYTIEAGVKREWHADSLPVAEQQQQQQVEAIDEGEA